MLVSDHVRHCVVFIGQWNERKEFVPYGTGFIICMQAYDFGFPFLVTAKHVIDIASGPEKKDIIVRAYSDSTKKLSYWTLPRSLWVTHPDHVEEGRHRKYIDVAAFHLSANLVNWEQMPLTFVLEGDVCTDEIIREHNIGVGDETITVGMFLSHIGETRNVPLVRVGNLAAMRDEPVPTDHGLADAYLMETRSIGGISGSPVFLHMGLRPKPMVLEGEEEKPSPREGADKRTHYLLGMVTGYYTYTAPDEWVIKTHHGAGDINTGISVVVPSSKIMETICQPSVMGSYEMRAKQLSEEKAKRSGARSAAAPARDAVAPPPANDENPMHLEDFTRLLGAAAKKREQED